MLLSARRVVCGAIIRNKSTEVGKESSRLEIRDGSLFSSSLSQSSSILPIRTTTQSQERTFCCRVPGPRPTPTSTPHYPYRISEEIYEAIKNNSEPVVALESAIITHGMPYPDNIQTAMHLQTIIRQQGVIPATVGVIKGQLTVGLSDGEIETLGSSAKNGSTVGPSRTRVVKVSRRDLPYVLSQKLYGGTTVSGTIIAAVRAKIPIFVTGGLGGVHRGAESTFDISADLKELGRSPIAVISAGVKSILDIGKTLEYLETEGVCVCVLKKKELLTDLKENQRDSGEGVKDVGGLPLPSKFPSFFTQESSFTAPYTVQNEIEAAQLLHSSIQFGLQSGILIAVPIPKEFAASGERIDGAIREALEKAGREGINGKDMTPFLLGVVNELTGGKSLEANKHLVENNARVGAQIALQLTRLRKTNDTLAAQSNDEDPPHSHSSKKTNQNQNQSRTQQHNSSSSHSQSHSSTNDTSPPHSNSHPNHHNHNDPPEKLENLNKRNRDKGKSAFDRKSKSASSKSSFNLHNLSRQSPIRDPMDKEILSTPVSNSYVSPTSTSTPTRMLSSTSLTSSHHTSNLGGAGGGPLNLNNTSNSAFTTRSPPPPTPPPHHGPIDFNDSDHRNPKHNGNEPARGKVNDNTRIELQPQPNGQFLAPFPDEDEGQGPKSTSASTSPSKPNSRNDFVKRLILKMDSESEGEGDAVKNRNGEGDVDSSIRRMEGKSSKSCAEVEPLEETKVPGKKESAHHPFSSTTRPIVIGGTSLDLVLRVQEENIVERLHDKLGRTADSQQ